MIFLKYLRKLPKKGLNSNRKNVGPTAGGGLGGFQCHSWRKNNDEATVIYKHKLHLELAFSSLSI